jgi:hypothetical protein
LSVAFAVLVAASGLVSTSTEAHAQTAGARGVRVLSINVLRGGYSNTNSHLTAAYQGSQWVFIANGTFVFTPSAGRGARRTGSYQQSGNTIEFEATGQSSTTVSSTVTAMSGTITLNGNGTAVADVHDAVYGTMAAVVNDTRFGSSSSRLARVVVALQ